MTLGEYIEEVISLQRKRDYTSAYNILQEALSFYPSNDFLLTSEIYLLLRLRKTAVARQKAEARLPTLWTNPFFLRTYIEILLRERDKNEILNIAKRLKSFPVKDENVYIYLSGVLERLDEFQEALELLYSGLLFLPDSEILKEYIGRFKKGLQVKGVNYYREKYSGIPLDEAIREIENILILPDLEMDINLRLFLAELYKKKGDLRKAAEVYLGCLRIKDSLYVRKMLGFVYYKMDEMDRAFIYLKDVFLENPEDHAVYNTLSKIIGKSGNLQKIEALLNKTLSRHQKAGRVYGLLRRLRKRTPVVDQR